MRRQQTREILGSDMKLILSRVTRAANFVGWNLKVTCGGHLVVRGFTSILKLDRAFDRAEERAVEAIKSNQHNDRFDEIFHRFVELPEFDRCGVAAYVMGMMKSRMTDDDLKAFNDQVEEMEEARAEFEAERKLEILGEKEDGIEFVAKCLICRKMFYYKRDGIAHVKEHARLDRQHEIIDEAEARSDAEEEVDVSDCCHSEDVQSVQPPLRSSVQSSPDDPHYICGSCEQKCEIETIKKSELED